MDRIRITENRLVDVLSESVKKFFLLSEQDSYEFNEIGYIEYSCSFDEDEYKEWLEDEGLQHSQEALMQFYKEYVEYELELFDSETYHHMDWQHLYYDDIVNEYGERIADEILNDCMKQDKGSLEVAAIVADDIDINNPEELDREAMKLLRNGRYFKDARGYILSNGVVIYTEAEHNMVGIINGVKGTFHFIKLGNIRVLPSAIDIAKKPTPQQERTLMHVIKAYSQDTLYVDFMTPQGEVSKTYNHPNFEMVMRDINRLCGE